MVSKKSFKFKGGAGAAAPAYNPNNKFFFVRGHSLIEQTSETTLRYGSIKKKFKEDLDIEPTNVKIYHLVSEGLCSYETPKYYNALGEYSKHLNKLGKEAMTILQTLRVEATPSKGKNNLTGTTSGWIKNGDTVDQDLHFYNSSSDQYSNLGVWDLNTLTAIDQFNPLQTEKGQTYNIPNICYLQQFSLVDMEDGKILKLSQIVYILMDMYPGSNIHIIHGSCRGATDGTQNTKLLKGMRETIEAQRKACPIPDQVAPEKIKFSEYIKYLEDEVLLTPIPIPPPPTPPHTTVWPHRMSKTPSIVSSMSLASLASMPTRRSTSTATAMSLASLASMRSNSTATAMSFDNNIYPERSYSTTSTTSTMSDDTVIQEPTQEYQTVFKGGGKSRKKRRYSKRRLKKSKRKRKLSKKKKRNSRKKYKTNY